MMENSGHGNSGGGEKTKKVLALGTFAAKTSQFFVAQFEGSDRELLAIDVEFLEGPNVGLHGTMFLSGDSMEFAVKTLSACGWVDGMEPTKMPVGIEVKAVVDDDTNPKTGVTKRIVKYINSAAGRKSALADRYGLDEKKTGAWNKQFLAAASQFAKATGFALPKSSTAKPAGAPTPAAAPDKKPETGPTEGGGSDGDDSIPFSRMLDI